MDRRRFVGVVAAALAAPLIAEGQGSKLWRIGVLSSYSGEPGNPADGLREGLRDLGYSEGQNIVLEWRWARGDTRRYPGLAAELVALKPDVIVAGNNAAVQATQRATEKIPIVMVLPSDPVGGGFAASLARPGGNLTGLTTAQSDVAAKLLQLLLEAVPKVAVVAALWDPTEPGRRSEVDETVAVATQRGVLLHLAEARAPADLERRFAEIVGAGAGALVVHVSTMLFVHRARVAQLAVRSRLPMIVASRPFADAGSLLTYGPDIAAQFRHAATYVDKILKGARPGELPIEQPTRLELVINLKTAKALGLTIPQSVLLRADQVIE